jgi:hypothetical protein
VGPNRSLANGWCRWKYRGEHQLLEIRTHICLPCIIYTNFFVSWSRLTHCAKRKLNLAHFRDNTL